MGQTTTVVERPEAGGWGAALSRSMGCPQIARAIFRRYVTFARRASLHPPARGRRGDPTVFAHHVTIARLVTDYFGAFYSDLPRP